MKLKLAIFCFVFSVILFPAYGNAAVANASFSAAAAGKPQIRIQIGGRRHDRGLHRGWDKGRRIAWYNYNRPDPQYVRQIYWINGRQYIRWVRRY